MKTEYGDSGGNWYKINFTIFAALFAKKRMLHYKTFENNKFDSWIVMIHGAGGSIEVVPSGR